jgi:hypothetical protein
VTIGTKQESRKKHAAPRIEHEYLRVRRILIVSDALFLIILGAIANLNHTRSLPVLAFLCAREMRKWYVRW